MPRGGRAMILGIWRLRQVAMTLLRRFPYVTSCPRARQLVMTRYALVTAADPYDIILLLGHGDPSRQGCLAQPLRQ
jgi:hypothetical protein